MARDVLRLPGVLRKTGWSKSVLYEKIADGKFPKGLRLDPDGKAVVWFEDEVEELQKKAIERAKRESAAAA